MLSYFINFTLFNSISRSKSTLNWNFAIAYFRSKQHDDDIDFKTKFSHCSVHDCDYSISAEYVLSIWQALQPSVLDLFLRKLARMP